MKRNRSYIILSLIIAAFVLTGCRSHNRIAPNASEKQTESSSDESASPFASAESLPSSGASAEAQDAKALDTEALPDEELSKTLHIYDILVPGIPALSNVPFMQADIEAIQADGAKLEKKESTKRADGGEYSNGYFIYWKDNGVVYVTHSSGSSVVSLILEKDEFGLNCGLKTGMAESDVRQLPLSFKPFQKEEMFDGMNSIAFQSSFLKNADSPFYTETSIPRLCMSAPSRKERCWNMESARQAVSAS
ncbi:hypothetical protein [Clostridium sp. AM58-1XD]|uniref:hypothetical protein n=1 Tax=Clostridium sp. AM58-1XD TaxID=2292307 RepID=UPI000E54705F|nr:hypothetical protein [Clostridium sp. AM58-1XD]RGZ01599.1 hypothetical protein DXA13_01850 [Clostridium sp. AM58-1XD]